ncbi:hypothetical protein CsSME_00002151 [Camellia sinensis var. sinensis]
MLFKLQFSLEKQKQVLDGQSLAFEGLQSLTKFQLQALEENRGTLQEFAELRNRQQEELLRRQELLQQAHDHLVESSKTILAALVVVSINHLFLHSNT